MPCPQCHRDQIIKNGSIHNGKPTYLWKACRRQFVEDPQDCRIPDATKALIDRLLLERMSLAGIARAVGVAERWLQPNVNETYAGQPRQVQVRSKPKDRLTIECDERWSFVGDKENKQWIWLAIDRDTRAIVGVAVGACDEATATPTIVGVAARRFSAMCGLLQ